MRKMRRRVGREKKEKQKKNEWEETLEKERKTGTEENKNKGKVEERKVDGEEVVRLKEEGEGYAREIRGGVRG